MQAYEEWFEGQPELSLLYLLGLFDHPIKLEILQIIWATKIPHLTENITTENWLEAVDSLREDHHLLSLNDFNRELDCHPLIREYFGSQLRSTYPTAWQQAHEKLYQYYKSLPNKILPDTLTEMQPLFRAVCHGCTAEKYEQVLEEVYWPRIQRNDEYYLTSKLGAFNDNIALSAYFFHKHWNLPASALSKTNQAILLNLVGFSLRSVGRLNEAIEPLLVSTRNYENQQNWQHAAISSSNLSELQLALGNIQGAISNAKKSVNYADPYVSG